MANSLIDFCDHKKDWENKARFAKERVEKYFNSEIMANRYMDHLSLKFSKIKWDFLLFSVQNLNVI